ncbi:hypothetical protein K8Q94_02135 [Candidatus Nomurabacteria bacterium]|nr:hypothetical protein [Candidatus Nomurabacteria bacterium]
MEQKSNGALISLIIIVALLVIGGFYLYQNKMKENAKTKEIQIQQQVQQDDLSDIETDLNNTDLESIDKNL